MTGEQREDNVQFLLRLNPEYRPIRLLETVYGMYLLDTERCVITSCINVETMEEDFSILRMSPWYNHKDKTLAGVSLPSNVRL